MLSSCGGVWPPKTMTKRRTTEREKIVPAAVPEDGSQTMSHWPTWPEPFGLGLDVSPSEACPYVDQRVMRVRGFMCHEVPGRAYQQLLDAGFRRSGRLYYQPACSGCRDCVPLRVPVRQFHPNRSQRRCRALNADLLVQVARPEVSNEKHALYARYVKSRHDGKQGSDFDALVDFLYTTSTDTWEVTFRDRSRRLLAVAITDRTPIALSAVYVYFDPSDEMRGRGLGTLASLFLIDFARSRGLDYYYMGYWIEACASMAYKTRFRPCEKLCTDGQWRLMS